MLRWLLRYTGRYSFVVTLLALCFLCFALAEARADTLGLPDNAAFAAARYPYARVLDGCTDWRRPAQYQDKWGPVSFAGACQAHDLCFHTLGASWGACNRAYLEDLRAACDRDLKTARLEKGELGEPDPAALQLCYEIGNLYFQRAQSPSVVKRFEIAQQKQVEYRQFVRRELAAALQRAKGRSASKREIDAAVSQLDKGLDLEKIELMAGGRRKAAPLAAAEPMPVLDDSADEPASGAAPLLISSPVVEAD